jgi:putative endonuclease
MQQYDSHVVRSMGKHNEFGKEGEQKAVDFLVQNGYTIKHRNYTYLKGEIDIVAQKADILAIVEVKSRTSGFLEDLANTVNSKKIKLVVRAADHYVIQRDLNVEVRFDIITIIRRGNNFLVEHIENAFYHF